MDLLAANLPTFLVADIVLACLAAILICDFFRREPDYWDNRGDMAHLAGGLEVLTGFGFAYLFSCSFVVFTPMAIVSALWLTIFH